MTGSNTDGALLLNLGTPDGPDTASVRRYLAQFLSDPRVIDLPAPLRFLLLRLVILPFRSPRSAEAYAQIWTEAGSPLLVHGQALRDEVAKLWAGPVALGMRYGQPSVEAALRELRAQGCQRLIVLPLYPQYATSSTESARDALKAALSRLGWDPPRVEVPAFFDDPGFLDAFAERGRSLDLGRADRVLFSFHGLPQKHVRDQDPSGEHCLAREDCCTSLAVPNCYRAQCFATARALAERLGLDERSYDVGFQSRLSQRWIGPFSDQLIAQYPTQGVKRVVVFSPSFVADCLETLEEVGMRFRDDFLAAGGEELELVPSLNSEPTWVHAVCELLAQAGAKSASPGV